MNFQDTREYITSRNFNPSKKMGQNFLINEEISKNIVETINTKDVDLVIEIGPGLGSLTDHLVDKQFDLKLIELDKR
ncbi:MAG: 16S rRNA (adenine(1518)-N(6)/adenine(1519)-N(6))-dimethyltransferase, partial [Mycoplasmoidaceae bacterium]|nr:16S rRNA (adenine(1518)-N(6)/adenine(1519)-N(6))-dimethyltransferase [Mycoplasmoidaceae bacterium]